jgi:hypothetical protein
MVFSLFGEAYDFAWTATSFALLDCQHSGKLHREFVHFVGFKSVPEFQVP